MCKQYGIKGEYQSPTASNIVTALKQGKKIIAQKFCHVGKWLYFCSRKREHHLFRASSDADKLRKNVKNCVWILSVQKMVLILPWFRLATSPLDKRAIFLAKNRAIFEMFAVKTKEQFLTMCTSIRKVFRASRRMRFLWVETQVRYTVSQRILT